MLEISLSMGDLSVLNFCLLCCKNAR